MHGWILDSYREEKGVTLWIKTVHGDNYVSFPYSCTLYVQACTLAQRVLALLKLSYYSTRRKLYTGEEKAVFAIPLTNLHRFEKTVCAIERASKFKLLLYDADIPPEQQFLFTEDISPGDYVCIKDGKLLKEEKDLPAFSHVFLRVLTDKDPRYHAARINKIFLNDDVFDGDEKDILRQFVTAFAHRDPDIVQGYEAFCYVPFLDNKLREYGFSSPFHRFAEKNLRYGGATTFYSYGLVKFRDYGVRLRGRFLVDTTSAVGNECDVEAIFAMCKLSGTRFQQLSSRSAGSVFQGSLIRALFQQNILVAHKQKPIPTPVSMAEMVEQDRAGLSLDAKIGVHTEVAELDFVSMFPFLMYQKNISPEKIGCGAKAPDVNVYVDQREKGFIPVSLKKFIDLRMQYKNSQTPLNKKRAAGLKSVLVSANGYLRFREFKLGLSTTHVALCSWVREGFIRAKHIAEEQGFEVVHGLVDSLYVKKQGITHEEVERLKKRIESDVGIPMSNEGIFSWIAFPPSVQDVHRPVVTRYFGALRNGGVKVRGIEMRQKSQPQLIRRFQTAVITHLSHFSADEIVDHIEEIFYAARLLLYYLPRVPASLLTYTIIISKQRYEKNIPQKKILAALHKKNIKILPGRKIHFVWDAAKGAVLEEDFTHPDTSRYRDALIRCLYSVLGSFGYDKEMISSRMTLHKQTTLLDWNVHGKTQKDLWNSVKVLCCVNQTI